MSPAQSIQVVGVLPRRGRRDCHATFQPCCARSNSSCSFGTERRFGAGAIVAAGRSCAAINKNLASGNRSRPENPRRNARADSTGRTDRIRQRIGVRTNHGAGSGAAWADTPDAAATRAYDPRAVPFRSAEIVWGSACRGRQNLVLPRRECAAIVADLLRGTGARE